MKSISYEISLKDETGQTYTFSGKAEGVYQNPNYDGYANDVVLVGTAVGISKPVYVEEA